jgi:putative membrane protein
VDRSGDNLGVTAYRAQRCARRTRVAEHAPVCGHAACDVTPKGVRDMKISLAMLMVVALATASGAQQPPTRDTSSSPAASGDSAFATKAAQANMAEVELGKLAQQKAMRDEVKQFGQRMVDDHSKSLDELKSIAMKNDITLPTEIDAEHKTLSEKLSKMSGAAFDREYMQAMVDGHRKVAADFRKESQSGSNADIKAYAAKTLPTIEEHLKHAQTINSGQHSGSTKH